MIELTATIIITASSVLLFGYWFRYTCLLILNTKTARDYAGDVAAANQLGFLGVQSELRANTGELDSLRAALDRDYAVLARLMKQPLEISDGAALEGSAMEDRMLGVNYRLMGAWYSATRAFSPAAARQALEEMSEIIAHFANTMGERAACSSAA